MEEIWKNVIGYEDCYMVSNLGNVKSLTRQIKSAIRNNNKITRDGRLLTIKNAKTGYKFIMLYKNGTQKIGLIHRLVATAFLLNSSEKKAVNHLDGDKANNRLENLEWCTYKENKKHAKENGLVARGEKSGGSKLTEQNVIDIRKYKGMLSGRKTALIFNISSTNIFDIWSGKIWSHI